MITSAIINFFIGLLTPIIDRWQTYDTSGWPGVPPMVADFLGGFMLIFAPGIAIVIVWRVVAYFLPGGAG